MATAFPDDQDLAPYGLVGNTTATLRIDEEVYMNVALRIGKKWKRLGRLMGFEEDQLSTIEFDHRYMGLQETVYQMLNIWKSRASEGATTNVLAQYLREVERTDLAQLILKIAEAPKGVASFRQSSNIYHTGRGSSSCADVWATLTSVLQTKHERQQIPRLPWLKDWEMDFDKYYVDLTINSKNDKETMTLHLNEIFIGNNVGNVSTINTCEVKKTFRILIEGPAGYGKSTLAGKFCFDHASGKEYIRHFEAVIVLRLRDLDGTLDELITNTLQLKDYTAEQVLEAIKQNQTKTLFILDGFDELHQDKHNQFLPLLERKQLPNATVIVTSRLECVPLGNESNATNLLHWMDSRILIQGITGENRIKFLRPYLSNHSFEKVASLISLVENKFDSFKKRKVNLFDCPLFLLLLVVVHEEVGIDSVKTKTELYKTLFNFILRRMFAKEGQTNQSFDFFEFNDNNPPDYVKMLSNFGSFAGEALIYRKYSFVEEVILQKCGYDDVILKLGILTQNNLKTGHKRRTWYEPLHLSFLEFSVAYYVWISLVHTRNCFSFFRKERIKIMLTILGRYSNILPFVFGLCGKELPALCSALINDEWKWLGIFTQYSDEQELIFESQLELFELVEAFLPLVPTDVCVFSGILHGPSFLLKETLLKALQRNRNKLIIFHKEFIVNSDQGSILSRKGSRYSNQVGHELSNEWEGDHVSDDLQGEPSEKSKFIVYSEEGSSLHLKVSCEQNCELVTGWRELINRQNILINSLLIERYRFAFIICKAHPAEQLNWLADWMIIEGIFPDKPIHEIVYWCSESQLAVALCKISQLISEEKVISFQFSTPARYCNPPLEAWKEFFHCANQSKQLLDIQIGAQYSSPVYVDLGGKKGKRWRKIELFGNVVVRVENQIGSLRELTFLDLKRFVTGLPSRICTLRVKPYMFDFFPLLVLVNNASHLEHNLRELRITITDHSNSLLQLFIWGYLRNLQVLAIGLPSGTKTKEQYIASSVLFIVCYCRLLVRLELWEGCSEEFIGTFLKGLSTAKCPVTRNRIHSTKATLHLNTLMLSPVVSSKNRKPKSTTVSLLKDLLLSGSLRQLWISCMEEEEGYVKLEFITLFSSTEGFICELEAKSADERPLWDWSRSAKTLSIFKISAL